MSSNYLDKLAQAAQFSPTTQENAALHRLSSNKDFETFMDVMTRYILSKTYGLVSERNDDQNVDLITHQGGYQILKRMAKMVDEALPTPAKEVK